MSYQANEILLEKYKIEALLGQGAFGDVYRVLHLGLRVTRALKVLRRGAPGIGSTEYADGLLRFQLEAQLGAMLNTPGAHPNLLQVHNFEASKDLLVLEMEYAPGGSLEDRLQKNKERGELYAVAEALQTGLEAAQGLSALHARDVIHRDIKPGNILLDAKGHAKVADLGLAQMPNGPSMRSKLSTASFHPGTAAYMSPEQAHTTGILTSPSDIYSLGLVLFELLSGRNYSYLRPGTRVQSLRADIPNSVDEVLARMLSKLPEDRPWDGAETAGLLAAELGRLQHGQAEEQVRLDASRKAEAQAAQAQLLRGQQAAESRANAQVVEKARRETEQREQELKLAQTRVRAEAAEQARLAKKVQVEGRSQASPAQSSSNPNKWVLGLVGLGVLLGMFLVGRMLLGTPAAAPVLPAVPAGVEMQMRSEDGMEMVSVPAGTFGMGSENVSDDEKPVHEVSLEAYWIDRTEVTNGMYAQCVQAGVCRPPSYTSSSGQTSYYGNSQFADYPVIYVDWNKAKAYCEWAGARLPSEAEWEYAARGTDGRTYPWGEGIDSSRANYGRNIGDTTVVGSYASGASPYGALDMAGNVWEWVADWYGPYAVGSVSNPTGPASGEMRVLRGGSWNYVDDSTRSAYRSWDYPTDSDVYGGFRCARSN